NARTQKSISAAGSRQTRRGMMMDVFSGSFPPLVAMGRPPASGNMGFAAELVSLSRKRLDHDGPKSACQSANFQITQWVRTISAARTAEAYVERLAARPLNLATGV